MQTIGLSWNEQPSAARYFLFIQLALVFISAVRFVKSARRLYRYSGQRVLPEDVLNGKVDPVLLAACALAGRLQAETVLEKLASPRPDREGASAEQAHRILQAAKNRFLYFWERCYADVGSARRSSLLVFLLSLVMVVYNAFPIFLFNFNSANLLLTSNLFATVWRLFALLTYGLSCCTVLYFASSFFERTLADRRIRWNYFCSTVKDELSHE
jgi:hypothetical protein